MTVWRYYLKMIRYEQFLIPTAMLGICLLIIMFLNGTTPNNYSSSVALGFIEAMLPLATAIVATSLFFDDPALELQYTVSRPLWRTLVEKIVLLIGVMTVFYLLFDVLLAILSVPLLGWSMLPTGILVWLAPALAWSAVAFLFGALFRNGTAANAFIAFVWIVCFLTRTLMMSTPSWRAVYPFLTIFESDSADWIINRAALTLIGLVGLVVAFVLLRTGERYFKTES